MSLAGISFGDPLMSREHQVGFCLLFGRSTREIAVALKLSVKTVDFYRQRLRRKLGARSHTDLLRLMMEGAAG